MSTDHIESYALQSTVHCNWWVHGDVITDSIYSSVTTAVCACDCCSVLVAQPHHESQSVVTVSCLSVNYKTTDRLVHILCIFNILLKSMHLYKGCVTCCRMWGDTTSDSSRLQLTMSTTFWHLAHPMYFSRFNHFLHHLLFCVIDISFTISTLVKCDDSERSSGEIKLGGRMIVALVVDDVFSLH